MTKRQMLDEMDARCWGHDLDENSAYSDIVKEYEEMKEEMEDEEEYDSFMYPNGRDDDSIDEEGL